MKLTILVDNHTLIDRYFIGEPGLALSIEAEGRRLLFDVGYSDALLKNARKMSINLLDLDYVVLSHGHCDHTWGLVPLVRHMSEAAFEGRVPRKPVLVAHPDTFLERYNPPVPAIGACLSRDFLGSYFTLRLTDEPVLLTDRLHFLGSVPRRLPFEPPESVGVLSRNGKPDLVPEDSSLAWRGDEGLVVITGCAHAGVCNTVEHARAVTGESRVQAVVGGFHLLSPSPKRLQATADYLENLHLTSLLACHCTGLAAKIALAAVSPVVEAGVGLTAEWR